MTYENNSIFWVEVGKIVPNPYQPRRDFDQGKLKELAESIRMYGILQPLTVSRKELSGDNGAFRTVYELIAGERRLRASKLAGLEQVPVIIRSGEETELMKLELAIIENLQREDLNAVDRGLAFKQLSEQFKLSHSQIARKIGHSRMYVSNTIRLLQLPDHILEALKTADINEGHARQLLMMAEYPEEQDTVFREILLKKLTVREVERIARKVASHKIRKRNAQDIDPDLVAIERKFTESLGTRVQIAKTQFGGKLTIDYFSEDDLKKLLSLVQSGKLSGPDGIDRETDKADIAEESQSLMSDAPLKNVPENKPVVAVMPVPSPVLSSGDLASRGGDKAATAGPEGNNHVPLNDAHNQPSDQAKISETPVAETPLDKVAVASSAELATTSPKAAVPAAALPIAETEPDDDTLYSIKNFSI